MLRTAFFASVSSLLLLAACSSDSDDGGGTGGTAGTGNSAGTAGTGGTAGGAGGSGGTTGGTGGSTGGTAGTSGGTGGSTGGSAGSAGSAGSGGSGGGTTAWTCPAGPFEAPVPDGATPMQVTGVPPADDYSPGFANVEGPVWIGDSLYFSHIKGGTNPPPSRILKLTGSDVSIFLPEAGTNGLAVGPDGKLYGARHSDGAIAQIDLTTPTMSTQVAFEYGDPTKARFNSPNDLAIRSDGNIYFSDPDYQAPSQKPQAQTRVYRISPTKEVSVVDATLGNPNGVTLSLDGDALFVTASGGLRHYPVNADGTTGSGTVIAPSIAGDGMGIDCAGRIYATNGQEVVILDVSAAPAMATVVDTIPVTVPNGGSLTNVAFGGPERKTLYITFLGSTPGLFKIDLAVPGMPY